MKKYTVLLWGIVICIPLYVQAQSSDKRMEIVHHFLRDFYKKPVSGKVLAEKYMYFQPVADKKVTLAERMRRVDTLATTVRRQTKHLFQTNIVFVAPYNKAKVGKRAEFEDIGKDVYIISSKDTVILYLYFHENRILSFYAYQKGKESEKDLLSFLVF